MRIIPKMLHVPFYFQSYGKAGESSNMSDALEETGEYQDRKDLYLFLISQKVK
jgi:hypothetical protein